MAIPFGFTRESWKAAQELGWTAETWEKAAKRIHALNPAQRDELWHKMRALNPRAYERIPRAPRIPIILPPKSTVVNVGPLSLRKDS